MAPSSPKLRPRWPSCCHLGPSWARLCASWRQLCWIFSEIRRYIGRRFKKLFPEPPPPDLHFFDFWSLRTTIFITFRVAFSWFSSLLSVFGSCFHFFFTYVLHIIAQGFSQHGRTSNCATPVASRSVLNITLLNDRQVSQQQQNIQS